jgi:hypothetical protein
VMPRTLFVGTLLVVWVGLAYCLAIGLLAR